MLRLEVGLCLGSSGIIILALTQLLASSKHCTNPQLSISLPVREEGSSKLILQLGRLKRLSFHPPGWEVVLPESHQPPPSFTTPPAVQEEVGLGEEVVTRGASKLRAASYPSTSKAPLRWLNRLEK